MKTKLDLFAKLKSVREDSPTKYIRVKDFDYDRLLVIDSEGKEHHMNTVSCFITSVPEVIKNDEDSE